MQAETRTCQNCKSQFTIEPEDFDFYEKIKVPAPTWCPECRLQRRLAWRNERFLHKQECGKCKKPMISVFSKETGLNVYCNPCWWSDSWDGLDYGIDFNPDKPFLEQLRDLLQRVPVTALFGLYNTLENSEYTNMVGYLKNCYLLTHSDSDENCIYGSMVDFSKDCADCSLINECELCYESVVCKKCYQTRFSVDCQDCQDVQFSKGCIGCSNCFGCVNLRNKTFHFFNKPCTREEYEKLVEDAGPTSSKKNEEMMARAMDFWGKFPNKYIHERHNANVSGDYVYTSKNTHDSYIVSDMEDSKFCALITPGGTKDCYDFTHYGTSTELVYDSLQVGNHVSRVTGGWFVISGCENVEYGLFNVGCRNTFGCAGLKKKEYCILNKQYDPKTYASLREMIIKQMDSKPYADPQGREYRYGDFLPIAMSPFGYNETSAQELHPLSGDEARKRGYNWREEIGRNYSSTLEAEQLPDVIRNVSDSITDEVISCAHAGKCDEQCTTAFKIIPQELQFYRKMGIPLPKFCPNCRYNRRLKWKNPMRLWHRKCQCSGAKSENGVYQNTVQHQHGAGKCPNEFETSYAPDRKEIVYCEQCYQSEVV